MSNWKSKVISEFIPGEALIVYCRLPFYGSLKRGMIESALDEVKEEHCIKKTVTIRDERSDIIALMLHIEPT